MKLPELRPVEVTTVDQDGETAIRLRDPLGYAAGEAVLSPLAFLIASGLDGEADRSDLQLALKERTGGTGVPGERIDEVVDFLDAQGFLLTPQFEALRDEANDAYRSVSVRPAALAGQVYSADPDALRAELDAYFSSEGGPGPLPDHSDPELRTRCLIVPHIDFARGGRSYAHGFHRLAQGPKPKTVIVFGVAHASPDAPFVMTRQDFDTPLGTLRADREMIDRLAQACDWNPFEDEIVHRDEHSIELPAVMLAHVYGSDINIVPILCGAFDVSIEDSHVERFLNACKNEASDEEVLVLAGADLAHVGRTFGDEFEIDDAVIERVQERDETDLSHALAGDPVSWYRSVMQDGNARRVCGLQCIYSALRSAEGLAGMGELLDYGYAHDPNGGIVTFSAIAAA
jgi:hypothetical protein